MTARVAPSSTPEAGVSHTTVSGAVVCRRCLSFTTKSIFPVTVVTCATAHEDAQRTNSKKQPAYHLPSLLILPPRSKQNSHHQIHVICFVTGIIDGECFQVTIFRGEQQIRPWTINHIGESRLVTHEVRADISLALLEQAEVGRIWIVLAECRIEFQFGRRLYFELRPTANRIEACY